MPTFTDYMITAGTNTSNTREVPENNGPQLSESGASPEQGAAGGVWSYVQHGVTFFPTSDLGNVTRVYNNNPYGVITDPVPESEPEPERMETLRDMARDYLEGLVKSSSKKEKKKKIEDNFVLLGKSKWGEFGVNISPKKGHNNNGTEDAPSAQSRVRSEREFIDWVRNFYTAYLVTPAERNTVVASSAGHNIRLNTLVSEVCFMFVNGEYSLQTAKQIVENAVNVVRTGSVLGVPNIPININGYGWHDFVRDVASILISYRRR